MKSAIKGCPIIGRGSTRAAAKQREFLKRPARLSTKASYAAFLVSKNFIFGPALYQAGPTWLN